DSGAPACASFRISLSGVVLSVIGLAHDARLKLGGSYHARWPGGGFHVITTLNSMRQVAYNLVPLANRSDQLVGFRSAVQHKGACGLVGGARQKERPIMLTHSASRVSRPERPDGRAFRRAAHRP